MFSNTFKIIFIIFSLISVSYAQNITFKVPNGWKKNDNLSLENKKLVFTPAVNKLLKAKEANPTEALYIEVKESTAEINTILLNNLINIQKEYSDFKYYKVISEPENSMGLGCTSQGGFCIIQRIEYYQKELYVYTYINNRPHYSQGLFGKWTNILGQIRAGKQPLTDKNDEVFEL